MTQPCACPCLARLGWEVGGGVLEHAKQGGNGTEIVSANREKMAERADVYSDFVFLLISGEGHKAGRIGI